MASLSKSQGKTAKKEARPRSPPEKKTLKASEEMSCVSEQHAPSPPLKGEDIQALAIRSEDLKKLREPQPPSGQQKPAAMMRVLVRKPRPPEESRKGQRVVVVARPLAQASTNQPLDYTGPGGPRFDAQGMVLPHSILGSLEDFRREMEARGETELLSRIPDTQRRRPQVVGGQKGAGVQSHALQHWHSHMRQRRRQQDFISNLLQKPVEGLLMNQSNSFRQTQEQRELLSRTLPAIHPGHGQRVGSEFWSLPEQFGEELSGVRATLTQSQRGRQQPLTHGAQPASIRHESGNIPVEVCDGARRTWDHSVYLKHCRQELRDVLKHLDVSQPEMDGLEVIGSGQPFTSVTVERSPLLEEEERGEELKETEQKENHDPLAQFDDVMLVPVLVPSLRFCGQRARWTGNGTSHKGEVGLSARVLLEALEGESVSSDLQIHNEGSTAIYYSWQRLPRPCSFPHTHTQTHTQHFYFNTSTGVILPGETQRVEFIFKSERAGVLGEAWRFNTHPVLMGGASLQVILRGVALCQDRTADQRLAIQRELEQRVAVTVCRSLVCDVLRGVRTPERPGSPAELYTTEEEHFLSSNPRLQYQYETVEALKALWQQVAAAGEPWDLSVTTLRQVVLALPQGEEGPEVAQDGLTREGALEHYNSLLLQLARPQHTGRPLPQTSGG
ncbi:MYCBP-associated protein, partial [Hypomesus transpacificus]|uniref:MYCBP-associated protein n=1 Tax=Hypomesus transpacificus TaxID=137520 RepID=UPI001F071D45